MEFSQPVCFTLFDEEVASPVKIFKEKVWRLHSDIELKVNIIGKSHRVVAKADNKSFTEFIAYPIEHQNLNPLDHFHLSLNQPQQKSYWNENFHYKVRIQVISQLFKNMGDFLESFFLSKENGLETLSYSFEDQDKTKGGEAFTGVAVNPAAAVFHTIHTYPENHYSIISQTEIDCAVPAGAAK